jgi:hypothetical protein
LNLKRLDKKVYRQTILNKGKKLATCLKQNSPKLNNMSQFVSPYQENNDEGNVESK